MADEPENHTIRLLQEMRAELAGLRAETRDGFASVREEFANVNLRIDGLTHIITLLAGRSHDHEERIARLEKEI